MKFSEELIANSPEITYAHLFMILLEVGLGSEVASEYWPRVKDASERQIIDWFKILLTKKTAGEPVEIEDDGA